MKGKSFPDWFSPVWAAGEGTRLKELDIFGVTMSLVFRDWDLIGTCLPEHLGSDEFVINKWFIAMVLRQQGEQTCSF